MNGFIYFFLFLRGATGAVGSAGATGSIGAAGTAAAAGATGLLGATGALEIPMSHAMFRQLRTETFTCSIIFFAFLP